jgi:multisubunit Na+/H+ antiporter MnhB subunit
MTGLAIFAVGFVFFEGVIGISGRRWPLPEWAMPVAIIVIGVLVLFRGMTASRHHMSEWSGSVDDTGPTPGDEGKL